MGLVLCGKRVVLQDGGKLVVAPARVHLDGARIARVERGPYPPASGADVDFGERLVTPAFVNAHTHLALAFLRGYPVQLGPKTRQNLVEDVYFQFESRLGPGDIRAFARMGAYESLLCGVGFVWDHYYGDDAVANALLDTGLCGVVAPTLQDLAGPGKGASEAALEATLRIAHDARLRERGVLAALGPHATDTVSPALFRRIGELAESEQLPVHLHVAQSHDELMRVETREGRSPIGLLAREGVLTRAPHVLMAHALFAPEADLRALLPERHTLVFCPSSQLQFGFPAAVPLWAELQQSWVVATDCASSNDSMNLQKELRLAAGAAHAATSGGLSYARFLERGRIQDAEDTWAERVEMGRRFAPHVTSEKLLSKVWQTPGSLHPSLRVGSIEAGALANLAVWDTEHPAFWPGDDPLRALAFGDTCQALHALYVAGAPIGTPGDFARSVVTSPEYREAKREAEERLRHVLR